MNNTDFQIIAPDPHLHRDAIYALLEREWEGIGEYGFARVHSDSHYDWHTSRIGLLNGEIVTHYGVYDITMRIEVAQVRAAGVNVVATHPDYRGRRLMARTANESIQAMHAAGYDLSVVCNATEDYYERFGYILGWPEKHLTIKADHLPATPIDMAIETCKHEQCAAFAELYNRDNSFTVGTAVRPTFPRGKHPGNGLGVRWNDERGALSGYILFDIQEESRTIWVDDSAGDVQQQLRVLSTLTQQFNCTRVLFERLSPHSVLGSNVCKLGGIVESHYSRGGGWMIKLINLHSLFTHLAPELERRLWRANLHWRGKVLLNTPEGNVVLNIDEASVSIDLVSNASELTHVITADRELAQLVVGTYPPEQLRDSLKVITHGDAGWLLSILFPAQDAQMSNDDL